MPDPDQPTTPLGWIVQALRRSGDWRGRAARAEYWWFLLFWTLLLVVPNLLAGAFETVPRDGSASVRVARFYLAALFSLPGLPALLLLPTFMAVSVRRLHDTGRSGWFLLMAGLPLVGGLILLGWQLGGSQPHGNRFGSDPAPPPDLRRRPLAPVLRLQRPRDIP